MHLFLNPSHSIPLACPLSHPISLSYHNFRPAKPIKQKKKKKKSCMPLFTLRLSHALPLPDFLSAFPSPKLLPSPLFFGQPRLFPPANSHNLLYVKPLGISLAEAPPFSDQPRPFWRTSITSSTSNISAFPSPKLLPSPLFSGQPRPFPPTNSRNLLHVKPLGTLSSFSDDSPSPANHLLSPCRTPRKANLCRNLHATVHVKPFSRTVSTLLSHITSSHSRNSFLPHSRHCAPCVSSTYSSPAHYSSSPRQVAETFLFKTSAPPSSSSASYSDSTPPNYLLHLLSRTQASLQKENKKPHSLLTFSL